MWVTVEGNLNNEIYKQKLYLPIFSPGYFPRVLHSPVCLVVIFRAKTHSQNSMIHTVGCLLTLSAKQTNQINMTEIFCSMSGLLTSVNMTFFLQIKNALCTYFVEQNLMKCAVLHHWFNVFKWLTGETSKWKHTHSFGYNLKCLTSIVWRLTANNLPQAAKVVEGFGAV